MFLFVICNMHGIQATSLDKLLDLIFLNFSAWGKNVYRVLYAMTRTGVEDNCVGQHCNIYVLVTSADFVVWASYG